MTSELNWKKSSYSSGQGQECVEATQKDSGTIKIRDSKNKNESELEFKHKEWGNFIGKIKH
ncbi:uncharacterized protein DUF397 [Haloactinospora alba]|uniref:Uncharacterized protein DUF397 n=1 Tax=Haloactinospora alba TaxID=405555 RepID=A0A543NLY1_9ACTN|nr:DUF397 domain-containing protein [Haloactinospora alba]TQN32841.1 uncharacterized protein DUF397 [Haloactinospora alba]